MRRDRAAGLNFAPGTAHAQSALAAAAGTGGPRLPQWARDAMDRMSVTSEVARSDGGAAAALSEEETFEEEMSDEEMNMVRPAQTPTLASVLALR